MSQLRCLVCGSSQLDPQGYKCGRCGGAPGLRTEECYLTEESKAKLLDHANELPSFGIKLEQLERLHKFDAPTTLSAVALAIQVADSLYSGTLKRLVVYLRDELLLPEPEILRLRLDEPEKIRTLYRNPAQSAFDSVLPLVKRWKPKRASRELIYRNSLAAYLRKNLCNARVETEYRHLGTTIDIYIKPPNSEVFVELKCNLSSKREFDRLSGQIQDLKPNRKAIIVVLCGQTRHELMGRLHERYKSKTFEVVLKSHCKTSAATNGRSHDSRTDSLRDLLELHCRRIRSVRLTHHFYSELRSLRDVFIEHGLTEEPKVNREFFDKWLNDPIVVSGYSPTGGWPKERITDLLAALDKLTKRRIARSA